MLEPKIGDKVKYPGILQDQRVWLVHDTFNSFIVIKNGFAKKSVYKEFWPKLELVK